MAFGSRDEESCHESSDLGFGFFSGRVHLLSASVRVNTGGHILQRCIMSFRMPLLKITDNIGTNSRIRNIESIRTSFEEKIER
jgi:hypothetical protein